MAHRPIRDRLRPDRQTHMRHGIIAIALLSSAIAHAQRPAASVDSALVARMISEGTERSHAAADLEYMLDVIGPRLSGSDAMKRANEWTAQKFREYGVDRAELEPWKFGVGWTRGPMTLTMLEPQRRELIGVSWAWAPGTDGPRAGDVELVDARTQGEFDARFRGKLRGKWIMLGPAALIANPDGPPGSSADSSRLDSLRRAQRPRNDVERHFNSVRAAVLIREGVAGVIADGAKEFALLTMSGSPYAILPYPMIVVSNETYSQFQRLVRRGERVRIEANVSNSFTRDALMQYNTVAELRGSERPDEVVLLGAHLDSWDLSTGATDNGTGAIAVLEAARILKASGARPKRTIRFVLFSGEEEGLLGSQAYADAHTKELDKFQAVLVLDNGTGRVSGIAMQGRDELRDMWETFVTPLASLGPLAVRSAFKTGTDHLSFLSFGVPAFNYDQVSRGYDHSHHSQVDDFNHIVPGDVAQAATVMAVNALQLANMPELLPRGKKE
jgi:carboxypeptidase Q